MVNSVFRLLAGISAVFAAGWLGVVAYSYFTLGRVAPVTMPATGDVLPPSVSGLAEIGGQVYAANGCAYCHTQEVRPASIAADIEKHMGLRRTVARDFVFRQRVWPGLARIGPDLANYGTRVSSPNDVYRHLFEPAEVTPGSNMPAYRFLFKVRKISGQVAWDAVIGLTGPHNPPPGYEVVPTEQARALAAYLLSLKQDYPLPEAPLP